MFCPSCQLVVQGDAGSPVEVAAPCPVCGGTLRDISAADAVEMVEATASLGGAGEPAADGAADASRAVVRVPERPLPLSLSRLSALPALAWRQPVVRAAVRTGASALALSLAVRAARAIVVGRRARATMTDTVLPTVAELLQSPRSTPTARPTSGLAPRVEIVETFIYVRRIVRR
jgi:hypothetical protein